MRQVRSLVPAEVPISLEILGEGPDRGSVERYLEEHDMTSLGPPARPRAARVGAGAVRVGRRLHLAGPARVVRDRGARGADSGLPVVARSGSGVGEFVDDGVNGFLTDDDASMAEALARLASDDRLRTRMRAHNLDRAPAQDWPRVAELAEAEYLRAVGATVRA